MNGSRAKQIRKIVRQLYGLVKGEPQYIDQERVIVINGWVNEDGKMVQKAVPIKAMGQRTHKPNTFGERRNFFRHKVRLGAES